MECKWCANSRKSGKDNIYCLLFGIMVHMMHRGCKYFKEKDEGNATNRNKLDDQAAEKTG